MNRVKTARPLPDWLCLWFQGALLHEIYPAIRAIAVGFSESRALSVRMYLDREPSQKDRENLSCILTVIFSNTSSNDDITACKEECIFSEKPLNDLDLLDGLVYARRERTI